MEQTSGLPTINIEPQREHLALLGLDISDIQDALAFAISGIQTGWIYEGDKRFKNHGQIGSSISTRPQSSV